MKQLPTLGAIFLTSILVSEAHAASLQDDILDIGRDGSIEAQINGFPVTLQFRGDGISYPVLNPDTAEKFKLRTNLFANALGIEAKVGPVTVPGRTGKVRLEIQGHEEKRRALWFDKPIAPGMDGSIGPIATPQTRIRLNTGAGFGHLTSISLPLKIEDDRVGTTISIDKTNVFVMFNPLQPRTVASAGAGHVMAFAQAGRWSGTQESTSINFGVERPVRELTLSNPIQIGNLQLSVLLVRDNSLVTGVADIKSRAEEEDANEVTLPAVTVTAKAAKIKPSYKLTLGQDVLSRCASITFDKTSNKIELNCSPGES